MTLFPIFLAAFGGAIIGAIVAFVYYRRGYLKRMEEAQGTYESIIEEAKKEAQRIKKNAEIKAKEHWLNERRAFEKETQRMRKELEKERRRQQEREAQLEKRMESLQRRERELLQKERSLREAEDRLAKQEKRLQELIDEESRKLESIAKMTREQAKAELLKKVEKIASLEAAQLAHRIREQVKERAMKEAKEIIATAIQRCSASHTAETTITVVPIPSDEMKGRIIGREGRNIRAFEALTGVEVIIDDTPEAVTLSAFDPIRREIGRLALERLIQDGRIHPARIEEVVNKVKEEFEDYVKSIGENTILDLGLSGMHPELLHLIGKMKFRTSYGQNLLQHSIEVAHLAGLMAGELGLNIEMAKRAGILHDIGKVVDQTYEGPHALVGAQIAKRYGENDLVVNAIAAHHEEEEPKTPIAILVAAADAISGARPGARRETLEAYIKRITKLEEIAHSYTGVQKAYAIQAGREIRIMVEANKVSDLEAEELARDIARRIESELEYPGQIKITVIRETRVVEYAR